MTTSKLKEVIFFVKGMHCSSCELIVEKKLLDLKGIKSVEASVGKEQVLIEYEGDKPSLGFLNNLFSKEKYIFSANSSMANNQHNNFNELLISLIFAVGIIAIFLALNILGLTNLVNITSTSSLPTFVIFGFLAGISTCAALVGGIILSMSKQWSSVYGEKNNFFPHLMFNGGRLLSYAIFGAILGLLGQKLQLSLTFSSVLVVAVSVLMIFFGLQMLGIKALQGFQLGTPKFITRYIADEKHFQGKWLPMLMGAMTFFLPCGFTITAQSMALISGSPIQGMLIMLAFALGTLPSLLAIGLTSMKLYEKPHLAKRFLKVAGVLVLFFALFNINSQMNVLGFTSINDLKSQKPAIKNNTEQNGLAPLINGKQVLKMNASSQGYTPNYFKIRAGIPVQWEITDIGTSGCTNAVISKSLFTGQIDLKPGQTSIKEFTVQTPGKYKFSCWMGMVSGIMEVVDNSSQTNINNQQASQVPNNSQIIESGAKGCGCGGNK